MDTASLCPKCLTAVPDDAPDGLCPTCLLKGALGMGARFSGGGAAAAAAPVASWSDPARTTPLGGSGSGSAAAAGAARPASSSDPFGTIGRLMAGEDPGEAGRLFDHFELLNKVARGGMGVVFRARDLHTDRIVALKMIIGGRLAGEAEVHRFRTEAEHAANLEHPNIVPIYEVGEYRGMPYYTMKFMEGGSLNTALERYREPRAAARLLATIAWAVHFGHQRGILHRDLKPHNILLDAGDTPHVSDFSLAKRVAEEGLTRTGEVFGTPSYMAPEQARGDKTLTTAVDTYALGAILYELLTGRPPFQGDTPMETLRQVVEAEPVAPSSFVRRIDRDLETICLKCLEKEPCRRYGSAEDLGKELERFLKGQPIKARYIGRAQRVWRWCLRFPIWTGSIATAVAFLVILTLAAISAARDQQRGRRQDVLATNVFAARHIAATVLWQLHHYSQAVVQHAQDPRLRALLARPGPRSPDEQRELDAAMRRIYDQTNLAGGPYRKQDDPDLPFESWFVLDARGIGVARWRPPPDGRPWVGTDFSGREYFVEALRHAAVQAGPRPHVSRVFKSHADGLYKVAISMPVRADDDAGSPVVGVLVATITTDATLGSVPLGDRKRKVVLAGPLDTNARSAAAAAADGPATAPATALAPHRGDPPAPTPPPYLVLFDQAYARRSEPVPLDNPRLLQFASALKRSDDELSLREFRTEADWADAPAAMDDHYLDPVSGGRWLAGFGQVGHSELIVVVQTRYQDAIEQDMTLAKRLGFWALIALAVGMSIMWLAVAYATKRAAVRGGGGGGGGGVGGGRER